MAECLHLNFGLQAGCEPEGKGVIIDRDLLNQLPDQTFIVVRHRLLVLIQKGFELIQFICSF